MSNKYQHRSDLPFSVGSEMEFGNVTVVMLEIVGDERMNQNLFGVGPDGRILWQAAGAPDDDDDPYVGLIRRSDNVVRACRWGGTVVDLDISNGRVLHSEWLK